MYKKSFLTTVFLMLIFLAACGGYSNPNAKSMETSNNPMNIDVPAATNNAQEDGDVLVLRLGHQTPEETNYHRASLRFKKLVEEKTDGKVRIDIYPFRQLGTDRELIEAMQFGTLDFGMISGPPISGFAPEAAILDLPFLFEDWNHVNTFLESDVEEEYRTLTEDVNLKIFGIMARGFRHVTTSEGPILEPGDFNSLTVRVIESPVYIDAYSALGASPQSMNFGDAYTALEQGAIDGQENTMDIIDDEKVYEVNSHVSKTGVNFVFGFLMASKDRFNSWPEDVQIAVREAAQEAVHETNQENEVHEEEYEEILEEKGMEIHEVDREPFKERVDSVYQEWKEKYGDDMLNKIQGMDE
ncbi:TRAP transporter substrate-binding protein [Virgibacillus ainsalahensis]